MAKVGKAGKAKESRPMALMIWSFILAIMVLGLGLLWRYACRQPSEGSRRHRRYDYDDDDYWEDNYREEEGRRGHRRPRKSVGGENPWAGTVYDFSMPKEMHDFTSTLRKEGARELGFRRKEDR